jgi:hypothetical protein
VCVVEDRPVKSDGSRGQPYLDIAAGKPSAGAADVGRLPQNDAVPAHRREVTIGLAGWDDLDAEANALRQAQIDIVRELEALATDPATLRVVEGHLRQHAERVKRFIEAVIRLRQ